MMNDPNVKHTICGIKCISWTAIFTGALVGIGLSFLLNLFGIAIGLSAFNNTPDGNMTLAIGGFVGLIIAAVVSMFLAGWVSGYLGRPYCVKRNLGELYGFATWCLALILTIFLTSHLGDFITRANYITNPHTTSLNVTNTENGPMVMTQNKTRTGSTTTQAPANTAKANMLGMAAFVTFFLFFMGALAASFGGRCGMHCRMKDENDSCSIR